MPGTMKKESNCTNCPAFKQCRDSAASWLFLFIGLVATLAVRLVTLVVSFGPFWPKFTWYVGVAGFLVYFLYKFRQDRTIQHELHTSGLVQRLRGEEKLTQEDYAFLRATVCRLRSKKDGINYFFIFFTSALSLILAFYQDFLAR